MSSQAQKAREGLLKQFGPDHEKYRQFCVIHDRAMLITDAIMQVMGKPSRRIAIDSKNIHTVDDLMVLQINEMIAGLQQGFRAVIVSGEGRILELEEQVKNLKAKLGETKSETA